MHFITFSIGGPEYERVFNDVLSVLTVGLIVKVLLHFQNTTLGKLVARPHGDLVLMSYIAIGIVFYSRIVRHLVQFKYVTK